MKAECTFINGMNFSERDEFLMSLNSTLNICRYCGNAISENDFQYAKNINEAITGFTHIGNYKRVVTKQHHFSCSQTYKKSTLLTLW